MGEVRSLNKNDFFYFAQFPLNFGWFVEWLIAYCELQRGATTLSDFRR
jgi:hypothetical protein